MAIVKDSLRLLVLLYAGKPRWGLAFFSQWWPLASFGPDPVGQWPVVVWPAGRGHSDMLHQALSTYCSSIPRWLAVQQHFGLRCSLYQWTHLYYSKLLQIGTSNLWLDSSSHASLCPGQSLYSSKKFSRLSCYTLIFSSVTSKTKTNLFPQIWSPWAVYCAWIHLHNRL